uniref:Plug domain-containing protein n=1 Tax=Phenylobacterium glaciei TaxID=2803784 RepID=A0A974P2A0_9CAUL|nr:Plug domain-containing protein [Phenylobacterium glaciei]
MAYDRLPASLSLISASQLQITGATDAAGAVRQVAGVTMTNLGPGRDKILLRGLSDGAFTGRTRSTVGTFLDYVPITYNAPDPDLRLADVQAIEVLRGPRARSMAAARSAASTGSSRASPNSICCRGRSLPAPPGPRPAPRLRGRGHGQPAPGPRPRRPEAGGLYRGRGRLSRRCEPAPLRRGPDQADRWPPGPGGPDQRHLERDGRRRRPAAGFQRHPVRHAWPQPPATRQPDPRKA